MSKKKNKKKKNEVVSGLISEFFKNDEIMGRVLGTYSDGTVRSLYDSLNGEFLSPKQKEDVMKTKKKNKKKLKKDKNKLDKLFK